MILFSSTSIYYRLIWQTPVIDIRKWKYHLVGKMHTKIVTLYWFSITTTTDYLAFISEDNYEDIMKGLQQNVSTFKWHLNKTKSQNQTFATSPT